jgi:hypothetical protein
MLNHFEYKVYENKMYRITECIKNELYIGGDF